MIKRIKDLFLIPSYGLLTLCMLCIGIGVSITMPYLSLYFTEERGISTGAVGIFIAVSSLSGVLVNSLIAKRSDTGWDRKWIIMIALTSSVVGYASYLVFQNFYVLLIMVTIFNGLGAAALPQVFAYAQESASKSSKDKTFAISTLRSLVSLGFIVGPMGGAFLLQAAGYEGVFGSTALIYLAIAVLILVFMQKRTKPAMDKKVKTKEAGIPHLQNRKIWLPYMAFIFLFAVHAINNIITPLFIVNDLNGTYTDVGIVVMLSAGLEIPIMLAFGLLGSKMSNHQIMLFGCIVVLLYFVILSMASESWHIIAAQLLQAVFVAIIMGNGLSYFSDLLPNSPGVSATLYANSSTIGKLIGNLSGGLMADILGNRNVYLVSLICVFMAIFIFWNQSRSIKANVSADLPS